MIKILYLVVLLVAGIMVIIDMLPQKKLSHKKTIKTSIENINKKLSIIQYKKGSQRYEELKMSLKKAGWNITPESYQTITILIPLIIVLLYIISIMLNYINLMANMEEMQKVAELLQDSSLLDIKLNIKLVNFLLVWFVSFFIIKSIPKIKISLRQVTSQKETLILQTYTIMMLKTEKPIKEILISLYERAKIFRPYLQQTNNKFSTDPNKALTELKDIVPNDNFKKICISLQQSLNNDKKLSVTYLENHRFLMREVNKQLRMRKGTKDQILGMLLMIFPMLICISIIGFPLLMYTIKSIETIPV